MKYIACFNKQAKNHLAIDVLLGLLILSVIALGFNQVARNSWAHISTTNTDDCSLLAVPLSFDNLSYPFRPNKNSSDKNHDRSSQNSSVVSHVSRSYDPHLFNTRFTYYISFYFKQFNHTCFLQDLSPPIFS